MHSPNAPPGQRIRLAPGAGLRLLIAVLATLGTVGESKPVIEKHANDLDLSCASYDDGIDWSSVRKGIRDFVSAPNHELPTALKKNMEFLRGLRQSDCYIGFCSVTYVAMLYMTPAQRALTLANTQFGNEPIHEHIPLSYWDMMGSHWPVFSLLELLSLAVRSDDLPRPSFGDTCCDRIDSSADAAFRQLLYDHLDAGTRVPIALITKYIADSPTRCSWGKGVAYFALAEQLLHARSPRSYQAAKDVMALGEFQLDRCASGRNVTVGEQMWSEWPIWSFLRRIETEDFINVSSQLLGLPPGYQTPPLLPFRHKSTDGGGPLRTSPLQHVATGELRPEGARRDVHVVLAGDRRHAEGALAAVNSLAVGTASPHRVHVHLFCLPSELQFYQHALRCSFRADLADTGAAGLDFELRGVAVQLHTFSSGEVLTRGLAVVGGAVSEAGDLNTPHNYVRFHLREWLPPHAGPKVVYLDTDVIVRADVCELHDSAFRGRRAGAEAVLAAVPRWHLPLSVYLRAYSPKMPAWLPSKAPSFNAGVMVINMPAWERANTTQSVDRLTQQNCNRDLWRHGSQPPLLLLLYDKVEWLDESWNVDGLGHYKNHTAGTLAGAKILHWTGPLKPWHRGGLHKDLWEPFSVHCWRGAEGHGGGWAPHEAGAEEEPRPFGISSNY